MIPAPSTAACLIGFARFFARASRDLLHGLVAEEDADQRVGLRRLRDLREVRRLDRERLVAALGRRLPPCSRSRAPARGSSGRPARATNAFDAGEHHRRLDRVELHGRELLGAPGLPVELAGDRLLQHRERRVAQVPRAPRRRPPRRPSAPRPASCRCAGAIHSIALSTPKRRDRRTVPPQPGKMPSLTSGKPTDAAVDITR